MTRKDQQLPADWIDAAYLAARHAAQLDGSACSPETADRIADAVLAALLAEAEIIEQVRDRPLIEPLPPNPRPSHFTTERRLALCTRPEPCSSYSIGAGVDIHGHLWFPVPGARPATLQNAPDQA